MQPSLLRAEVALEIHGLVTFGLRWLRMHELAGGEGRVQSFFLECCQGGQGSWVNEGGGACATMLGFGGDRGHGTSSVGSVLRLDAAGLASVGDSWIPAGHFSNF